MKTLTTGEGDAKSFRKITCAEGRGGCTQAPDPTLEPQPKAVKVSRNPFPDVRQRAYRPSSQYSFRKASFPSRWTWAASHHGWKVAVTGKCQCRRSVIKRMNLVTAQASCLAVAPVLLSFCVIFPNSVVRLAR